MSKCNHDLVEREMEVHDGCCPICLQSENAKLKEMLERMAVRTSSFLRLHGDYDEVSENLRECLAEYQKRKGQS